MLPFLQPKKQASVIIAARKKDESTETIGEEGEHPPGLMAAAEDVLSAVANKDATALAGALKAAFECCDAQPHEEGPHEDVE
jgi:hypothetical protein